MNARKIARSHYNSDGIKSGKFASTKRAARASKRSARAKIDRQIARDNA